MISGSWLLGGPLYGSWESWESCSLTCVVSEPGRQGCLYFVTYLVDKYTCISKCEYESARMDVIGLMQFYTKKGNGSINRVNYLHKASS